MRTRRRRAVGRSVLKMMGMIGLAAAIASVGIAGCHDMPVEPAAVAAPEPSLGLYPTEEQFAEMAPEFRTAPSIFAYWVRTAFVADEGVAWAWMQYWANYARLTLPLTLMFGNSEVTTSTGMTELASVIPATREMEARTSVGVYGSCGHTLNATGNFFVRHQVPIGKAWFFWGEETATASATASQPDCTCKESTDLKYSSYDPYAESDPSGCGSEGETSTGTGTQYGAGDLTGGETVNWNTGIGNGGTSACGEEAVVDYICIDVWNEQTQSWEEWSCGYATVCGYTM